MKRTDYISWDDYFMGISLLSGMRSKDPSTQVGACIVDKDNRIVSIGYNGFLNGCSDEDFPWSREGEFLETKYPYVVHAEQNAIIQARCLGRDIQGATIYVTTFPCITCAKMIIQSGIETIVYQGEYNDTFAREMLNEAGIQIIKIS